MDDFVNELKEHIQMEKNVNLLNEWNCSQMAKI